MTTLCTLNKLMPLMKIRTSTNFIGKKKTKVTFEKQLVTGDPLNGFKHMMLQIESTTRRHSLIAK